MTYFRGFPKVDYTFGTQNFPNQFQLLNLYVDLIDQIKHQVGFYRKYYIETNERPDSLSFKLYGTEEYYWTFFLINDNLRLSGWPYPEFKTYEVSREKYPNTALVSTDLDTMYNNFLVGQTVKLATGEEREIVSRDLNLGQIVIEGDITGDNTGSNVTLKGTSTSLTVLLQASEELAIHHYEDSDGSQVDIDPRNGIPVGLVPVSNLSFLSDYNENLRVINVIKEDVIDSIVADFRRKVSQ